MAIRQRRADDGVTPGRPLRRALSPHVPQGVAGLATGLLLAGVATTSAAGALGPEDADGKLSMQQGAATMQDPRTDATPSATALIEALGLKGHVEGGFYRRTYEAMNTPRIDTGQGERFSMTSIFYLLTAEGPIGHFHRNRSDIVHYFHLGDPIEYVLIHPDGRLETVVMGPDPTLGHRLQLTVAGGIWKASRLMDGSVGYGLISEAVTPGFDYADMALGRTSELAGRFPAHADIIRELSREHSPR